MAAMPDAKLRPFNCNGSRAAGPRPPKARGTVANPGRLLPMSLRLVETCTILHLALWNSKRHGNGELRLTSQKAET